MVPQWNCSQQCLWKETLLLGNIWYLIVCVLKVLQLLLLGATCNSFATRRMQLPHKALPTVLAFTGNRSLKISLGSQLLAEELLCGSTPSPNSCVFSCWTGPGHQWIQPVRGRDPPGAGCQEEGGRGAETETRCFQREAVCLQVTTILSPLRTCRALCCTNAASLSMCVFECPLVYQTVVVLSQTQAQSLSHAGH